MAEFVYSGEKLVDINEPTIGNRTIVSKVIAELQNKINTLVEKYCEYCQEFDCDYCSRRVE